MRILDLPLKKEWYNMIESGIKTEEYREIKPYWIKRLCDNADKLWQCADTSTDAFTRYFAAKELERRATKGTGIVP